VRRARRALAPLCAIGLALVVAACGVPVSGSPRALSDRDLPPPQAASPPTTAADEVPLTIVLISPSGTYTPALRAALPQQDKLSTALTDLLGGPLGKEIPAGITSAIPSTTTLLGVTPNPSAGTVPAGPVTVDLSEDFLGATGTSQILATGQVVLTISCYLGPQIPVRFEIESSPQPVPIGTGADVSQPVTAADYLGSAPLNCTAPSGV
jgi:spore germination protein GerM